METRQGVTRGESLARNTVLNVIGQGIPFVVALASMPFLIHRLGGSRFGILSLAWAVVGYFTVFDLGLGRATTKHVAEALGSEGELRVPSLVWTAIITQTGLGILGCLALASLTPFLVGRVFHIPPGLSGEAKASFFLLAVSIPATLVVGSLRGVLEAAQRFDLVNAIRAPLGSANFLLPCLGALLGWGVSRIIGLLVLSSCVAAAVYYQLCTRVFPALRVGPRFRREELTKLLRFGTWVMVSSIVGPILVYLDRFILATLLSIAAVGYYSAPYEMVTRLLIIASSLAATLFPAFTTLSARQQPLRVQHLITRSVRYLLLLLGPIVIITIAFARDILSVWLGSSFAEKDTGVLAILAAGVLMNSFAQVPYALIQAFDRPDVTAKLHMIEVPIHIVLVWALIVNLGIAGAALAWSLRVTLDAVMLFWIARRLTHMPLRVFFGDRIPQTIAILVLLAFGVGMQANFLHATSIKALVSTALLGTVGLGFWRYSLDSEDRSKINRFLHRLSPTHASSGRLRVAVARKQRVDGDP